MYLYANTIRWWRILAGQWKSETSTTTSEITIETNGNMNAITTDRITTCRQCKLAKVKCNKCPDDCTHCLGGICTRCCKHIRRGDPHILCVHDRKKPLGRPKGSKNIIRTVVEQERGQPLIPLVDVERVIRMVERVTVISRQWYNLLAFTLTDEQVGEDETHSAAVRRITEYDCEDTQVGTDEKVQKVGTNGWKSRHGYGLRVPKNNIDYTDNSSTHEFMEETKNGTNDETKDTSAPTKAKVGNKDDGDNRTKNVDDYTKLLKSLFTEWCNVTECKRSYYKDMKSALTQVKQKMSPVVMEIVTDAGWTDIGKEPETALDDLAQRLILNRKALLKMLKIKECKNNNEMTADKKGTPGNKERARKRSDEEGELKIPAITHYMTDGEALIQVKNKMGPVLINDLITLGWNENDRTDEQALDGIAQLMQRNREQLLRKEVQDFS